jgi:hypothetical protein
MTEKRCDQGHFYTSEFWSCPHCEFAGQPLPTQSAGTRERLIASLGTAPDGLPWRLSIDRGPSAEELLTPIATRLLGERPAANHRSWPITDSRICFKI